MFDASTDRATVLIAEETSAEVWRRRFPRYVDPDIEIEVGGKQHLISAKRPQILDLLISTCEQATALNQQLASCQLELARSNETLAALCELTIGLNHCRTEEDVASFAARSALNIPGIRGSWLFLREAGRFRLAAQPIGVHIGEHGETCECQRRLDSGALMSADNVEPCACLLGVPNGARSQISIPLLIGGSGTGLLNLVRSRPEDVFSEDHRRMFSSIGRQIGDALGRVRLREELEQKEQRTCELQTEIVSRMKADSAKDEFLAKVSHELRTPLTPIHGALTIIKSGKVTHLPEQLEGMVDLASRNCTRLMSIVNDLLDFSRFSSGRFSLDRTTVDIEPIVGEVVQNKRIAPNPPNIELNIQPEAKGAMLDGDPIRIQQVLDNLLSNAMKFTEAGGHIEVNVERHGGSLRVSVGDHGPGIPKCFQARVFDAFAQADSSAARRQGGVGLGLTICKSIVEAHGGSIGFMSNEGEGATFYFELPLATG
jgi:signal transduction histidine kinase